MQKQQLLKVLIEFINSKNEQNKTVTALVSKQQLPEYITYLILQKYYGNLSDINDKSRLLKKPEFQEIELFKQQKYKFQNSENKKGSLYKICDNYLEEQIKKLIVDKTEEEKYDQVIQVNEKLPEHNKVKSQQNLIVELDKSISYFISQEYKDKTVYCNIFKQIQKKIVNDYGKERNMSELIKKYGDLNFIKKADYQKLIKEITAFVTAKITQIESIEDPAKVQVKKTKDQLTDEEKEQQRIRLQIRKATFIKFQYYYDKIQEGYDEKPIQINISKFSSYLETENIKEKKLYLQYSVLKQNLPNIINDIYNKFLQYQNNKIDFIFQKQTELTGISYMIVKKETNYTQEVKERKPKEKKQKVKDEE